MTYSVIQSEIRKGFNRKMMLILKVFIFTIFILNFFCFEKKIVLCSIKMSNSHSATVVVTAKNNQNISLVSENKFQHKATSTQ